MTALLKLFDWVPSWLYAATLAAVLALLGISTVRHTQTSEALHKERAQWAQMTAQAEREARAQSEKFRAIEQELSDARQAHEAENAAILDDLSRARSAARVAAGGLRDAAHAAAQRARKACEAGTTSAVRETTGDAIGVFAQLLGRIDERAGVLADAADRAYIAGRACEREYDNAREALSRQ